MCITIFMFPEYLSCEIQGSGLGVSKPKKFVKSSDNVKHTVYCGPTLEAVWMHVKLMVCIYVLQNYIVCMGEYR